MYVWKEKHAMDTKQVRLEQASNKQELSNWGPKSSKRQKGT